MQLNLTKLSLVQAAHYAIQPVNGFSLFYSSRAPHGANINNKILSTLIDNNTLISRASTEGLTVSSLICDCLLMLCLQTLSISHCLNH